MKKATVFTAVTIIVSQVLLAFIVHGFLCHVRWRVISLRADLPWPTELALLTIRGFGVLVHLLPILVSGYMALRIFLNLKKPDYNPTNLLFCMIAIAIFQIAIDLFCILSILLPLHA